MTRCLFFHLYMNPDSFEINMHLFMKTEFYPLHDRTSCFNTRTLSKLLGAHESVTHYYFSWIDAKKDGGMALEVSFYSFKYFGTMTEPTNLPQEPRWTSENWWWCFVPLPDTQHRSWVIPHPCCMRRKHTLSGRCKKLQPSVLFFCKDLPGVCWKSKDECFEISCPVEKCLVML